MCNKKNKNETILVLLHLRSKKGSKWQNMGNGLEED